MISLTDQLTHILRTKIIPEIPSNIWVETINDTTPITIIKMYKNPNDIRLSLEYAERVQIILDMGGISSTISTLANEIWIYIPTKQLEVICGYLRSV